MRVQLAEMKIGRDSRDRPLQLRGLVIIVIIAITGIIVVFSSNIITINDSMQHNTCKATHSEHILQEVENITEALGPLPISGARPCQLRLPDGPNWI